MEVNWMDDLSRLRTEYADRERRLSGSDLYSWFNTATLFTVHQRQRALLQSLKRQGLFDVAPLHVLEIGCGAGGILTEFVSFGARPHNLFGVDLLPDRLCDAQKRIPGCHFYNADGQHLPFRSESFDLVIQFTALSSILDPVIRQNICQDMVRVLRPAGRILWYDFWLNPTNPQTRGIRPEEVRQLFPGCRCTFQRITLAPPITRKLATVSWGLCLFLESLKLFNTHYLGIIQRDH
jgi:ubiquinone/menaquinone biosynthesis C-methylase UbiE